MTFPTTPDALTPEHRQMATQLGKINLAAANQRLINLTKVEAHLIHGLGEIDRALGILPQPEREQDIT